MAAPLRRVSGPRWFGVALGAGLFALPLVAGVAWALAEAADLQAWRALADDPAWPAALALSVGSAVVSTLLALAFTMVAVTAVHGTPAWPRLTAALAPLLAVPHAAFAVGLAWLLAPTGAVARLLAPWFGWTDPPAWPTVHDPWAVGLTVTLVLKETPFLLWSAAALLARPELAARLAAEQRVARTLGHGPGRWWWRAGWPQLLPLLGWPLLAVLAYGLTVVDLALVIGPTHPPTAALLAWADLQDALPGRNARGAAGAVLLAVVLSLVAAAGRLAWLLLRPAWDRWATRGVRGSAGRPAVGRFAWWGLPPLYALVLGVLVVLSVAGPWPFPQAWPESWVGNAWAQVRAASGTVVFSVLLAAGATALSLLLVATWLDTTPPRWDGAVTPLVLAPLALPPLMLMAGLYRGALALRLDGSVAALLWAHVLVVLPYVFLVLRPAWRDLDPRFAQTAATLGRSRWAFRWQVQRTLLAAPIAAAAAVGFAVSVGQFLATQMLGAGRLPTLATEAVTLASGGERRTAAAFALLLALWPLLAFGLARYPSRRPA